MFFNTYLKQSLPARFSKHTPTLYNIVTYLLAVVLAFSGIAKLVDASGLLNTLQQITFLNEGLIVWIATLLPVVELALAAVLFLQWKPTVTISATSLLFAGFLGFAIYGFTVGWSGDCGCFGGLAESGFGWGMIFRNGAFLSLSVAALAINYKHLRKRD